MKLISGKKIANKILQKVARDIERLEKTPGLAVILVGDDPASHLYVGLKEKAAEKVGINFQKFLFNKEIDEQEILEKISELKQDEKVNGIIVQLPLPEKFNTQKIIEAIDFHKDADGFHPHNMELFFADKNCLQPVFPQAIWKLVKSTEKECIDKKAVIVTQSDRFGKTMQEMLRKKNIKSNYVLCEKIQEDENEQLKNADIIITACGITNLINTKMTKNNAVIIDGGIKKVNGQTYGDVDMKSFANSDCRISPVPGGVGPVTVACLLDNVIKK